MTSGVYQIRNIVNNKIYIGSSNDLRIRFISHKSLLKNNRHFNIYLQNAYNKYGKDNFIFEIIAVCPVEYIIKLEQWFLDKLKPDYNICAFANSPGRGRIFTQSHINKIQKSRIEKGVNNETSIRMKGNKYSSGSKRTKEEIKKLQRYRFDKVARKVNKLDLQGNLIATFNSIKEAAESILVSKQAIHKSCNKPESTCKGFQWKYVVK